MLKAERDVEADLRQHPDRATVEHVVPLWQSGADHVDNVVIACQDCNTHQAFKHQLIEELTAIIGDRNYAPHISTTKARKLLKRALKVLQHENR